MSVPVSELPQYQPEPCHITALRFLIQFLIRQGFQIRFDFLPDRKKILLQLRSADALSCIRHNIQIRKMFRVK